MNRKEYVEKLRSMIEESSTNQDVENEMLDRLEDIDDLLLSLELDIEEQYHLKEIQDYPTTEEMESEFNYSNRF